MRINHEFVKFRKGGRQLGVYFIQCWEDGVQLTLAAWFGGLYLDFHRR